MPFWKILFLSFIEGLTEFLPVSSTAHLILTSQIINLPQTEFLKAFEIIIQFGAIMAVVYLYPVKFKYNFEFYSKLFIGFLPAAILGFLFKNQLNQFMENNTVIALALITGGVVLYFIDHLSRAPQTPKSFSYFDTFRIGCFQCLGLIPGVSRSGASIVGAQIIGFSKQQASEFSFFLAVPTLTAASFYKLWKIRQTIELSHSLDLLFGVILSFIFSVAAMKFFIAIVNKYGFKWFGIYRILIGLFILL